MVVGVVDNDGYNSVITKSPFNFKNNNINFMTIYRDEIQIPSKPLNQILPTIVLFEVMFVCLRKQVRTIVTQEILFRENSTKTVVLCLFLISPPDGFKRGGFELIKHGNIRIEIHFATATARTLTVIVFAKHDNLLEIDQDRNVAFDYTA